MNDLRAKTDAVLRGGASWPTTPCIPPSTDRVGWDAIDPADTAGSYTIVARTE